MQYLNVDKWLQRWADERIQSKGHVEEKSALRDLAAACATDAREANISIAELKQAAGGDLERYLMEQHNAEKDPAKD